VAIIETSHRPTTFNKMNTGIYQKDKLRRMVEVDEQVKASSLYTTFSNQDEKVEEVLLS
jgi:hypothetical protein